MDTRIIEGCIDGQTVTLTISEATALIGMRRTRLIIEARATDEADVDRKFLHERVYPDVIAPVIAHTGYEEWPPDFEDFINFPDVFIADWEETVYALNPHWLPGGEKKAPTPPQNSTDD